MGTARRMSVRDYPSDFCRDAKQQNFDFGGKMIFSNDLRRDQSLRH